MSKTPHWDTPYGSPRPGGSSKLLVLLLVFLVGGGFMCMGCMVLGFLAKEDTKLKVPGKTADAKTDDGPQQTAEQQAKNKELAQLEETADKFKAIIRRKLDPVMNKLRQQRADTRRDLLALRKKTEHSKAELFRMKKLLEEFKEINRYIKSLEGEKEKYETQITELDFAIRKVKRNLEVSEFLDEGQRKEVEKLLARGSVLLETAEKGLEGGQTLESQVAESSKTEAPPASDVKVDLGEIDDALGQ
ncbi:MAG: hypothetical protein AB7N76_03660 [Planctomycetota bacterium]